MKLKNLLKPFLAVSALGTGAYYLNYKKPSHVGTDENSRSSLKRFNKDIWSSNGAYTESNPTKSSKSELTKFEPIFRTTEEYKGQLYSDTAMTLAFLYEEKGKHAKAIVYWWEAYFVRIMEAGNDHPDTIQSRKILIEKEPAFFQLVKSLNEMDNSKPDGPAIAVPETRPEDHDVLLARHREKMWQEENKSSTSTNQAEQSENQVEQQAEEEPNIIGDLNKFLHEEM